MGLTLNIIAHELERFGAVTRVAAENPSFERIRMCLGSMPNATQGTLFLCSSLDQCVQVSAAGGQCILVQPAGQQVSDDTGASPQAAPEHPQGELARDPASSASPAAASPKDLMASAALTPPQGNPDVPSPAALVLQTERLPLEVFDGLLGTFDRYRAWEQEMDACASREDGLQALLDASAPFLQNNVVVVDPALKLLAHTRNTPCDDPITMELIEHGYHTEENIRKFKLHKRFRPWAEETDFIINNTREVCKYTTVVYSFKTRHSFSLIIVMMCNACEPSDHLLDVYRMFASRVERFALRDYPEDKPSGNATDTFLRDLLHGELDTATVQERCKHVGIPYQSRFCLFYIQTPAETVPAQRLLADIATAVAPAKTVAIAGGIAVLCFNCLSSKCSLRCESGTCPSAQAHRSISSRMEQMMEKADLLCGRGSKFKYLHEAPVAFEQARMACKIAATKSQVSGGIKDFVNWKRIFSFERCFAEYLVQQMGDASKLALCTYGGRVIDAMAQRDAQTGSDDYEFLFEYLVNERKPSAVAQELHMHRNNVKYRIDKIEERFGIDTSDPALRLMILFAYKLREAAKAL